LYVYDSTVERSAESIDDVINPLLSELDGYVNFVAMDCIALEEYK
jgi:hypothetical protein